MPFKNKADQQAWAKKYYRDNHAVKVAYRKAYYQEHKTYLRGQARSWYATNKDDYRDIRKVQSQRWAAANKPRRAKTNRAWRIRKYGLDAEAYTRMYAMQNGCCAICGKHFEKLAIDHSHVTGKVRELLCRQCNTGLGFMQDSEAILQAATQYLVKHKEKPL
jgi:hypothetical protein